MKIKKSVFPTYLAKYLLLVIHNGVGDIYSRPHMIYKKIMKHFTAKNNNSLV